MNKLIFMLFFFHHCHRSKYLNDYDGENLNVNLDDDIFLFIVRRSKNRFPNKPKRDGWQEMKRWKQRIIIFRRGKRERVA